MVSVAAKSRTMVATPIGKEPIISAIISAVLSFEAATSKFWPLQVHDFEYDQGDCTYQFTAPRRRNQLTN